MSKSNGTQNLAPVATNNKKSSENDKRRKSRPKIPGKSLLTENKSKLKPWQKLKTTAASDSKNQKNNQEDEGSVRYEMKDGEGVISAIQTPSSDLKIEDISDDQSISTAVISKIDIIKETKKLNGVADISRSSTPLKEKFILPLSRAGSSKKERTFVTDIENINEKKSLLSKREPTKTSLGAKSQVSVDDTQVQNNATVIYPPEEIKPKSVLTNDESYIRSAIPYLPLGLSVMCLCMNIFIPGSGTIISGVSILCCGKSRLPVKDDQRMTTICVNVCVGVAQLFTVTFLLVGWFWSLAWGFQMVSLSVEYKLQKKQQRERELQTMALSAFGNPVNVRPLFQHI